MSKKRVYGKRKADAPRAVFDENSPLKASRWTKRLSPASPSTSPTDSAKTSPPQSQPKSDRQKSNKSSQAEPKLGGKAESRIEKEAVGSGYSYCGQEKTAERNSGKKCLVEEALDHVERRIAGIRIEDGIATNNGIESESGWERTKREHELHGIENTDSRHEPGLESRSSYPKGSHSETVEPKSKAHHQKRTSAGIKSGQSPAPADADAEAVMRPTRKKKPPPTKPRRHRSSGFVHDDRSTACARPILNEALSSTASQGVQRFNSWASRAGNMLNVIKIAEGSYGEVYSMCLRPEMCHGLSKSKLERLRSYGEAIFKVVPLRAQSGPGSKKFTGVDEIVSEVRMLKYLDPVPGFARFREIHVVRGRFPKTFQDAWDLYKRTRPADDCLNPNPASKKAYPDSQLWAILEMDDAGCELEKFPWRSIFQIYDIFWGVSMALARAEEYALFEVCHKMRVDISRGFGSANGFTA